MKKIIIIILLAIQVGCISTKSETMKTENYIVYHEGDSLTSSMAEKYLNYKAINPAFAGSQINDVYKRVAEITLASQPEFIIVLIGINNIIFSSFNIADYRKLINYLHSKYNRSIIICVSILPANDLPVNQKVSKANMEIKSFCQESDYIYLDVYKDMLPSEYRFDGLHLTDAGYKKLTSYYNKIVYDLKR